VRAPRRRRAARPARFASRASPPPRPRRRCCARVAGNHAFVGLGFNTREDAFDLKSCLGELEKAREAEAKGIDRLGLDDVPSDLLGGLKPGQSISIKLAGGGGGGGVHHAPASGGGGGAAFKIAAPGARIAAPAAAPAAAPPSAAPAESSWETF
jgi:hypothetical protein